MFGLLTVVSPLLDKTNFSGSQIWNCLCHCGKPHEVCTSDLVRGHTKSCGCLKKSKSIKVGQKFGRLMVTKDACIRDQHRNRLYECQCECGKQILLIGSKLKNGHTKSCGCLYNVSNKENGLKKQIDLSGRIVGRLLVKERIDQEYSKTGSQLWLCQCKCGTTINVPADSLLRGRRKSCGCLTSAGEQKIEDYLRNRYCYQRQYTFTNCKNKRVLPFDFCIKLNDSLLLIEYHGKQHYEECYFWESFKRTKLNDEIKSQFCKKEGIPLLVIPYTCKNINVIIEDFILCNK